MAAEPLPHDHSLPASDDAGRVDGALWRAPPSAAAGARRADRQDRVVQSLAHKVTRPCRRNGCPAPARASMVLDYAGKRVTLVPLLDERDPRFLELCPSHATTLEVPRGWDLVDERGEEPEVPTGPPSAAEMGSSATVAVLAAALRDVPEPGTSVPDTAGHGRPAPDPAEPDPAWAPDVADPVDAVPVTPDAVAPTDAPTAVPDVDDEAAGGPVGPDGHESPPVRPTLPSGRTARPRGSEVADDRQLSLDGADDRPRPRPVPAARPEHR